MTDINIHGPGEGLPKSSTQTISMVVGWVLFIIGLCGILFSGFAGLHMGSLYSLIIAVSGGLLIYNGYKNNSRDAFRCCLAFGIFYGLHALAGWILGAPGVPQVGHTEMDSNLLQIIPKFHELGRNDHILNTILSVVLMGGAIDWWRRHSRQPGILEELKSERKTHRQDRPIRH